MTSATAQEDVSTIPPGNNLDAEIEDVDKQLPDAPNPPLKKHSDFVHCLPPNPPTYRKYSLFLAGSIEMGNAIQWQRRMVTFLEDQPITVCNPRRGHWNPNITPEAKDKDFRTQVEWELKALEAASVICFFFDKNTKSPVTMMELGLWAHSKKVVVCCDAKFWKGGNVHLVCERYGIPCVTKFEDLIPEIKKMLAEKGMKLNTNNDLVDDKGMAIPNTRPAVNENEKVPLAVLERTT